MSARLRNARPRIADLPHGQVTQFERQNEAAGFTPEMLLYFLENSDDHCEWVRFGKVLYDNRPYSDPEPVTLGKKKLTVLRNGFWVRFLREIDPGAASIEAERVVDPVTIYTDRWIEFRGAQMQFDRIRNSNECLIKVRYRRG